MRYDVCLSCIGEDIRRTFLSHLLHSLDKKCITSVTSAASNPSENEVVRRSLIAVSVISKNYTSLDLWVEEQARIIGCQRKVVPVFLRVDPVDVLRVVRLAQDSVNIDESWKNALQTVQSWLISPVTSQSGFNSIDWEDDSQLVEQITLFISNTLTQDSIPHRWFTRLDWLRSTWEESHSLQNTHGLYSSRTRMASFRPYPRASRPPLLSSSPMTPVSHSSNPSETVMSSWGDRSSRMIPFVNRSSSRSETVIELSSNVAPMTPMSHSSSPSETVMSSWWNRFIRMIPFVNRSSNRSETVIELSSDVAPVNPMSHRSNPSATVMSSWWDRLIRMIPFLNRTSNRSETGLRRGMNHRVEEILSMLQPGDSKEEVLTVGICGMEGVGKTTLAKKVYQEISSQFQHHFFVSNFSQKGNNLLEILASETTNFSGSSEVIEDMVGRKVLLVADSIADIKQLKSLTKEVSLFGPGSRVIVITQRRYLLFQCGLKHIYEVGCPGDDEAIQLFSQFAFRQTNPLSGFERLSGRAVKVAGRIPLALKVLGSYLHGMDQDEWESTLRKLEKTHNNYTTEEVLKCIGVDVSARQTRAILELEENEENDFPLYFFTLE